MKSNFSTQNLGFHLIFYGALILLTASQLVLICQKTTEKTWISDNLSWWWVLTPLWIFLVLVAIILWMLRDITLNNDYYDDELGI